MEKKQSKKYFEKKQKRLVRKLEREEAAAIEEAEDTTIAVAGAGDAHSSNPDVACVGVEPISIGKISDKTKAVGSRTSLAPGTKAVWPKVDIPKASLASRTKSNCDISRGTNKQKQSIQDAGSSMNIAPPTTVVWPRMDGSTTSAVASKTHLGPPAKSNRKIGKHGPNQKDGSITTLPALTKVVWPRCDTPTTYADSSMTSLPVPGKSSSVTTCRSMGKPGLNENSFVNLPPPTKEVWPKVVASTTQAATCKTSLGNRTKTMSEIARSTCESPRSIQPIEATATFSLPTKVAWPRDEAPKTKAFASKTHLATPATSSGVIARGSIGTPGTIQVNYIMLNLDAMPDIAYHYDINIEPDHPKKLQRIVFEKFHMLFFKDNAVAFDGRHSFYTTKKISPDRLDEKVEILDSGNKKMEFKVKMQLTANGEVSLRSLRNYFRERIFDKPMRALQCLEVVLASSCHGRSVRSGRAFYTQPDKLYDLGNGCEMWTGLYQAVMLGDKPFMNVDITHKPFSTHCQLIDYLCRNCNVVNLNRKLGREQFCHLSAHLRGLCVTYEPPKSFKSHTKNFHVNCVMEESAESLYFQKNQGPEMTVAEYFLSQGCKLKYPKLNVLHVGSKTRTIYLPMECCSVSRGQPMSAATTVEHTQQMIRFSATSTNERKHKILHLLNYFNHNANDIVTKFGLKVGNDFLTVPMRVLRSPTLEYFSRETIIPGNGAWHTKEMTKFLFTKRPVSGHKWAIIHSTTGNLNFGVLLNLGTMIAGAARRLNMVLQDKPKVLQFSNIDTILATMKRERYDLVVTVVPRSGVTYAEIKQSAELRHGVLTQCVKEETLERRLNPQIVSNMMLKINAKLNGTNHKISADAHVPLKYVMLLGADVSHPSPEQSQIPSVVGVVGSHDSNGACYNMEYRLQRPTLECIENMESIFSHHIKIYHEHIGRYPEHVIYYRDGVSDGQFPTVKMNEIAGIRWACTKLHVAPKLTCIIVVKRHHTRFFPQTQTRDRFNNVLPGTVVDRIIVHPNEMQFFMVSHQSVQGTAKPTRYNVIENDGNLDINMLQTLTYNLCHMFPRCNRPVSYPTPAYLAHLVASRGRVYIEGCHVPTKTDDDFEYETKFALPEFVKSNPMYFV